MILEALIFSSSSDLLFTIVCSREVVNARRSQNYFIDSREMMCVSSSLEVSESPQKVVIAFFIWLISLL